MEVVSNLTCWCSDLLHLSIRGATLVFSGKYLNFPRNPGQPC